MPDPVPNPFPGYGDLDAFQKWYMAQQGGNRPEDMQRFLQGDTLNRWDQYLVKNGANAGRYKSMRGAQGFFDKPTECPPGMVPSGPNETDPCVQNPNTGPGGPGGGAGPQGGGGFDGGGWAQQFAGPGGVPKFEYTPFQAPTWQDIQNDPGYQFRLSQGTDAIQKSAAAQGLLRSGGTLKDILNYGQGLASQEYGNVFNRALQGWQANLGANQFGFGAQYQPWAQMGNWGQERWQTGQNTALQKYLQRENTIANLLNMPPPAFPGGY